MEWVSIGEPVPPALTPTQQRIKELLGQGKSISEIGRRLRMRADVVREEIFEIRKLESFMGTGKLTSMQRAAIYQAWKEGTSNKDLAAQYGVTKGAISQIVAKLKAAEAELYAAEPVSPKPSQINQAFDAAVDAMIAESKAADAEKKSMTSESKTANAEKKSMTAEIGHSETDLPAEKDTSDTEADTSAPEQPDDVQNSAPDKVPECVISAVMRRAKEIETKVVPMMQEATALNQEYAELLRWLSDHV